MAKLRLSHPTGKLRGRIQLPGSKSESNRFLLLKALYAPNLPLSGLSDSGDTEILQRLLNDYQNQLELNAGDAGTAMRFFTAFLAAQEGEWTLDGSERMRERPIAPLVKALRELGAEIEYPDQEGYPPLKIKGRNLKGGLLHIDASLSSQYLSALMMIAPSLEQGLEMRWDGQPVSMPYIYLTANCMRRMGFKVFVLGNEVRIPPQFKPELPKQIAVEPDWSAASYWLAMAALAQDAEIYLPGFRQYSMQGDSIVAQLMAPLGVEQTFIGSGIRIHKAAPLPVPAQLNLLDTPDLSQSLIPAYAAKGKQLQFCGLQTLRIKETDRIAALQNELQKFGEACAVGNDFLHLKGGFRASFQSIATYGDHRMAMGFAALALLHPIAIENPEVVTKSYPAFWEHCKVLGFVVEEL
ncbi:3-phosphoshikimate 1-carboxyvinyltransferase [Croceimicrobium sp.]|uniref:3-phosphoshikimate 1-carboxyvinyltransferase n=1 Tax=Croceimicrobium sp. TaxID=2828340 RepID=UPI003BAC8E44